MYKKGVAKWLTPFLLKKINNNQSIGKIMAFDIEMIKKVYEQLPGRVQKAREVVGKPLTLTEKILYSHLYKNGRYNCL